MVSLISAHTSYLGCLKLSLILGAYSLFSTPQVGSGSVHILGVSWRSEHMLPSHAARLVIVPWLGAQYYASVSQDIKGALIGALIQQNFGLKDPCASMAGQS
ncbi:hypothetical protein B0H34DRAFT_421180 [Crassisporium funariophilum]|nr:hypothetical protein B0H34DRAFT_421180 [Crassisporium funariophilum]